MKCNICGKEYNEALGSCPECARFKDIFSYSKKEEPEDLFASEKKPEFDFDRIDFQSFSKPIIEEFSPEAKPENPPKKKSKAIKWILSFLLLLAAAVAVFFILYLGPSAKIERLLTSGKYDAAVRVFEESYDNEGGLLINHRLNLQLDELYENYKTGALDFNEANGRLEAIKKMEVDSLKKKVGSTDKKLKKLKSSFNAFKNAEDYYSRNNYELSIKEYRKVIKADPNYETASKKKEQAENNFKNTCIMRAEEYASKNDYASAIKTLKTALKLLKGDKLLKERLEKYEKSLVSRSEDQIIAAAEGLAEKKDYASAILSLESAISTGELQHREKADKLLKYYREEYEDGFLKKIEKLKKRKEYIAVAELIFEAESIIPQSNELKNQKNELSDFLPIPFDELSPTTASNWQFGGIALDSFGIDRSREPNYILLSLDSKAEYSLDSAYKTLSFTVSASKEMDPSAEAKLIITAEREQGEATLRECTVSAKREAEKISVDIENAETLLIEVSGQGAGIILSSIMLAK